MLYVLPFVNGCLNGNNPGMHQAMHSSTKANCPLERGLERKKTPSLRSFSLSSAAISSSVPINARLLNGIFAA